MIWNKDWDIVPFRSYTILKISYKIHRLVKTLPVKSKIILRLNCFAVRIQTPSPTPFVGCKLQQSDSCLYCGVTAKKSLLTTGFWLYHLSWERHWQFLPQFLGTPRTRIEDNFILKRVQEEVVVGNFNLIPLQSDCYRGTTYNRH